MPNDFFRFQQFTVNQSACAMKVGTDGVLLGAWADISGRKQLLDIGAGTGLIALMCAQRSDAGITAVELDPAAAEQASENIQHSPWARRIELHCMSFQKFAAECKTRFDVIISNPPYFDNARKAESKERTAARHNDALPFTDLLKGASALLTDDGSFFCILPAEERDRFLMLAESTGLYPKKEMITRTHCGKKPMRVLFEFTRNKTECSRRELIVHEEGKAEYSAEYKAITKGFYLNF